METGVVNEYYAKCNECGWHSKKFGNRIPANEEMRLHQNSHKDCEVIEHQNNNHHPEISELEAKLLFIRKSAQEAYEKGEIVGETKTVLKSIVEILVVDNMTKEQVGLHIGNLEKARAFLAAHTQGIQIAYAKEAEPILRAKREREKAEKIIKKTLSGGSKQVNDLIELAKKLASGESVGKVVTETKSNVIAKVECPNCHQLTYSIKFHKCPVKE